MYNDCNNNIVKVKKKIYYMYKYECLEIQNLYNNALLEINYVYIIALTTNIASKA